MMRYPCTLLAGALTPLLGVMLLATIYVTVFDLEWIAFLSGVLFAGVAAMASPLFKSHWPIARRTQQLQRVKHMLADERTAAQGSGVAHAALLREPVNYEGRRKWCP